MKKTTSLQLNKPDYTDVADIATINTNMDILDKEIAKKANSNHNHTKNQITDFPSSLKNPNSLTISLNGVNQGPYDGSNAQSINITASSIGAIDGNHTHNISQISNLQNTLNNKSNTNHTHTKSQITDFPSSLKNPNALTISLNGASQGVYDGSTTKSINITTNSIGAASSDHVHSLGDDQITDVLSITKGGTGATTISEVRKVFDIIVKSGSGENSALLNTPNSTIYNQCSAKGNSSTACGMGTSASGDNSFAGGNKTTASGENSLASGYMTIASGENSFAIGEAPEASGKSSFAIGLRTQAEGNYSFVCGYENKTKGFHAFSAGVSNEANNFQAVFGKQATVSSGPSSIDDDYFGDIFKVGCGSPTLRKNAFRIENKGNCYAYSAFNSSGADFAEYFEWLDDNPNNEDRRGLFVTLDGEKIRIANSNDDVIGAVSATPTIIGDTKSELWKNTYKTDVFGCPLTETIEIGESRDEKGNVIPTHAEKRFILNPDYDSTKEYIGRQDRKEWAAVGLVGKLIVIDDGTCIVNGYCKVLENGKATRSTEKTNIRVMSRINDNHIKVLIK